MAESIMITSYSDFIKSRWANGDAPADVTDALFDSVTAIVKAIGDAPIWSVPQAAEFHGSMDDYPVTIEQLRDFVETNIDDVMREYWDDATTDLVGGGIEAHEADVYQRWLDTDPSASADNVDTLVRAFIADELTGLEDTLFPSAQMKFLSSNMVFSSMYGEFIFSAYKKVLTAAQKLRAEQTTAQVDKAGTRLLDMLKIIITRGTQYSQMRADMMYKKTQFKMQFGELKTKLAATTNQMIMSDTLNAEKAEYATELTAARWDADNAKYRFEAFAAIHGGLATTKKTEESGWDAMDGFQKTVAVASAAVSLGQGIAAAGKDIGWWGK